MESIGHKLISARESLGFSVEQIARETNIAKSYLIALESEDFSSFPGEAYLLGFLRNYSEYLNLDPEEMVTLYRNMMIQEQPAPIEELLEKRGPAPRVLITIIIVAVVLGLGAAGYFYIYPNYIAGRGSDLTVVEKDVPETENRAALNIKNTYEFSDEVIEKRFKKNEAISIIQNEQQYLVVLADIGDSVVFFCPSGELTMTEGEETVLDLDGDSSADIRMLVRAIDAGNNSVVLHIDRFVQSSQPGKTVTDESNPSDRDVEPLNTAAAAGTASVPSRKLEAVIVREADAVEPFTLNIVFRGYCLLRYEADSSTREEKYFHKMETFRLDVNKGVRLWISNAGALTAKINGVDIELGKAGEVTARDIRWGYNSEKSKYELELIPVY